MIGTSVSHYVIKEKIGKGGMGEVYRARDPRLNRDVAIKVMSKELAKDRSFLARFENEGQTVAAISHPNTVAIFDIGVHDGVAFAVMELLEGHDLATEIKLRGALAPEIATGYALQIAHGLAAIHSKGVQHRDLKPANIFLTNDQQIKILDFGLAKTSPGHEAAQPTDSTVFTTNAGSVIGTPNYMSPERLKGAACDESSDMFAWSLVFYEMLTGKNPFTRQSIPETMSAILSEEAPVINVVGAAPEIIGLIVDGLKKDPLLRLTSAEVAIARLQTPTSSAQGIIATVASAIDTLAVLPFHNEASDEDSEYLIDGLTDLLIDNLSQLPRLKVMARSTVFQCRDLYERPDRVGQKLGVRAVLTGRLQQRKQSLVIRAELVDATDGTSLWSGRFNRQAKDLLAIEEELCGEIIGKLRFRLTQEEQGRIAKRHTEDPLAHEAYLQGRFFWNRWKTPEAMRTAIGFFERAVESDPLYARAYAGLADSYCTLGNIKSLPPREAYTQAKTAALQGLAIDDTLAELHSSLGFILRHWEWNWDESEKAFKKALDLNPGYAPAYRFYGSLLTGLGQHDQAIAMVERALNLDPLSLIIHTSVGDAYFYAGRYDESMTFYRKAIEMDNGFLPGHTDLARALELAGRFEEAIAEYQLAESLAPKGPPEPSSGLAHVYAKMGRKKEAFSILDSLHTLSQTKYVSPYGIASIYACAGDSDNALTWLEKAHAEHDQTLVWLKVHPRLHGIHDQPRYQALLAKMNLA